MLLGEFTYQIGPKHRLALPKKLRDTLGDQLVVTRGYEGCLLLVQEADFSPLVAEIATASVLDEDARATARFLLGGATELLLDAQGRFVLPDALFRHAELEDVAVFVGLGRWVELWSQLRWVQQQQFLSHQGVMMAQRLRDRSRSG